jgi:hypothetical protein
MFSSRDNPLIEYCFKSASVIFYKKRKSLNGLMNPIYLKDIIGLTGQWISYGGDDQGRAEHTLVKSTY